MLSDKELEKIIESSEEYKRFNDLPLEEQAKELISLGKSITSRHFREEDQYNRVQLAHKDSVTE